MKKSILIFITISLFLFNNANAQLINQPDGANDWSFAGDVAQEFTLASTTDIGAIAIRPLRSSDINLYIYDNSGTVIYSQNNISLTGVGGTDPLQIINLTGPVTINGGQNYFFLLEAAGSDLTVGVSDANNPYPTGDMLINYRNGGGIPSFVSTTNDLAFAIYKYQAPTPAIAQPKAIPATSLWAVITLLSTVFAFALYRRTKQ